jgi:hypothetical protein
LGTPISVDHDLQLTEYDQESGGEPSERRSGCEKGSGLGTDDVTSAKVIVLETEIGSECWVDGGAARGLALAPYSAPGVGSTPLDPFAASIVARLERRSYQSTDDPPENVETAECPGRFVGP